MKKILIFLLITFLIFTFVYLFTRGLEKKPIEKTQQPLRALQPKDFNKDYSVLYKTIPGKSSTADVIKINGNPESIVNQNNKTFFYYATPSRDFKNLVLFEDGIEILALENIFGDYRGNFENFSKAYGSSIKLYEKGSPFIWHVFLQNGIGVETNEKDITKFLYFIPQGENSFLNTVSKELGLSKETPTPEVLRP